MASPSLTIRINADAGGAISALGGTTTAMNNLNSSTHTTAAGILLTGNAARSANSELSQITAGSRSSAGALGQLSSQTNQATTSIHSMTAAMSQSAQSTARWVQELNNSTRTAQQAAGANEQLHRSNTAVSGSFNLLKGSIGGIGLAFLAHDLLKVNIEMEMLRARLDAASSSLASSKAAFSMILQIAKDTPQSISEITKAFTMLKNFGIDPTEKTMRGFTDVTSKLGGASDTLTGIIRAFGQANGKAALHAQDANQMIERGVPVYGLLVKVLGKSTAEIMKMMEAGELGRDTMEKLRQELFKWADGSSEKMMNTLGGRIEGLSSAWSHFQDVLMGDKSEGILKSVVKNWTETIELLTGMMETSTSKKIVELQEKLANPSRSFISKGLQSLGVMDNDNPDRIRAEIARLRKEEMQSFLDARKDKKIIQDQADGEKLANNAAIAKDADAFMKQQMGLIKENQQAYFDAAQEKYNISAKALKSLAALESGFNNRVNAGDRTKAQGMFQFFPAAAKDMGTTIDAILKDESLAVEKGAGYFAKMLDASNGHFIEAVARFHDGSGAIDAIIKKRGAFDLNLASKEGQLEVERFEAGLKVLGVTVSDLEKPYQQAAQATKHLATESEAAAKKIAENDRQLTESTAFGKYNATIDELTEAFKRGGISQATYSQGIENANETLFKNTDYVTENEKALKKHTDLLEQQAKAYEKIVGHVGDYNATIDESTSNRNNGLITPQQHGLNVAQANAGLMNKVTDKNIPVNKVGEVIDKQNAISGQKELEKFTAEMEKSTTAFESFGNSGKMAFDGILGGISAVASAAQSFTNDITKLDAMQKSSKEKYDVVMASTKASEEEKATATKLYAADKEAYNKRSFEAEINGAMSIAGATAKMFNQKSVAARAFHGIEMGLAIISMAMSAKKMIVDIAGGAAAMFAQSGWAGFAGVAAMAAVMAGLGVAMTGGGGKTIDNTTPESKAEGTILGDPTATSNSIDNIIKTLNAISDKEYPKLKAISDSFRGVDRSMYELRQTMAQSTANFSDMSAIGIPTSPTGAGQSKNPLGSGAAIAGSLVGSVVLGATNGVAIAGLSAGVALFNAGATSLGTGMVTAAAGSITAATAIGGSLGMAAGSAAATMVGGAILGLGAGLIFAVAQYGLGKLLGIGKVTYQQIGEGIVIGSGKLADAVDASTFRKDIQKTTGWFSDSKKVIETYGQLSGEMADLLNGISSNLNAGILGIVGDLNLWDALGYKLASQNLRPALKIDFFKDGKRVEDTNKVLGTQINAWMDRTATNVFGLLFSKYQKIGEGMMETAVRLTTEVASVRGAFEKMHLNVGDANLGMVYFSDTLVKMYASSSKADDGLKNLMASLKNLYDFSTSKGQKSQDAVTNTESYLASIGYGDLNFLDTPALQDAIRDQTAKITAASATATTAQTAVETLTPAVNDYWKPTPSTKMSESLGSALNTNKADWQRALGVTDLETASWATVSDSVKRIMETRNSKIDQSVIAYLNDKESIRSSAEAAGGSAQTIEQNSAALTAAKAVTASAATAVTTLTNGLGFLNDLTATSAKIGALQDRFLKINETTAQTTGRERTASTALEYKKFTEDLSLEKYGDTLKPIIDAMKETGKYTTYTAADLQDFVYSMEDAKKATDATKLSLEKIFDALHTPLEVAAVTIQRAIDKIKLTSLNADSEISQLFDIETANSLKEATTAMTSFKKSIAEWVLSIKTTKIGNFASQKQAAQDKYDKDYATLTGNGTNEEKAAAQSAIVSDANTLIDFIKKGGASGKAATDSIAELTAQMEGLPEVSTFNVLTYDLTKSSNVYLGQIANNTLNKTNQTAMNASDIAGATGKLTGEPVKSISAPTSSTSSAKPANDADYGSRTLLDDARKTSLLSIVKATMKSDDARISSIVSDHLISFNNTNVTKNGLPKHSSQFFGDNNKSFTVSNLPAFAKGGVTNQASIFGEAGWEAAVPLPDGRSIPVIIQQAPSKQDDSEVVAVLTDGFGALLDRIEKLERALTAEQRKTTTVTAQANDKFYTAQSAQKIK